jgi:hypothetical protein
MKPDERSEKYWKYDTVLELVILLLSGIAILYVSGVL